MSAGLGITFAPVDLPPVQRRPLPQPALRPSVSCSELRSIQRSPERKARFVEEQPQVIEHPYALDAVDEVASEDEDSSDGDHQIQQHQRHTSVDQVSRRYGERSAHPLQRLQERTLHRPRSMVELHDLSAQQAPVRPAPAQSSPLRPSSAGLHRNTTLLAISNNASKAELGRVLSPAHAKPLVQPHRQTSSPSQASAADLEQSKSKARVELDVVLDSTILVEGCLLKGRMSVKSKVQNDVRNDICLGVAKVRIVGFEELHGSEARHIFYHHSAPIESDGPLPCYASDKPDEEGFYKAKTGSHDFSFSLRLPLDQGAKGPLKCKQGGVKYIVIGSIKVRSQDGSNPSIAHFYRPVTVYPYLDRTKILAPSNVPVQASEDKSLFLGGSGKVTLKASLHRSDWAAGQLCYVAVSIHNQTSKKLKSLALTLVQRTTVYNPPGTKDKLEEEMQSFKKKVAENLFEVGKKGASGEVTARGMWLGVEKSSQADFMPSIVLPSDALSLHKSVYLEVSYVLRVSVSSALSSDISVELPLQIFNFVSLDPPPGHLSNTLQTATSSSAMEASESLPIATLNQAFAAPNDQQAAAPDERRLKHHMSLQCISSAIASATARRGSQSPDQAACPPTPERSAPRVERIDEASAMRRSYSASSLQPSQQQHPIRVVRPASDRAPPQGKAYAFATPSSPIRATRPAPLALKSAMKSPARANRMHLGPGHRRATSESLSPIAASPLSPMDMPGLSPGSTTSSSSRPSLRTPTSESSSPEPFVQSEDRSRMLGIRAKSSLANLKSPPRRHSQVVPWQEHGSPAGFEVESPRRLVRHASAMSFKAPILRG